MLRHHTLTVVRHLMKHLNYILLLGFLICGCEQNNDGYKIKNRTKTISKENCQVAISFPEIINLDDDEKMAKLNQVLENFPEHEYYARNCGKDNQNKIRGEYQVLLQNDSILSVEFRTLIQRANKKVDTVYHSVVVNPNRKSTLENEILGIEPNEIIPNFKRGMIYSYIEKYSSENENYINLLAYETGSNYVITWAVTEKEFIVYVGGEGEWFGHNRVKIPISELK
jgi:hypothetical protein